MNTRALTDTQTFVLRATAMHPEQRIESFPKHVKGGARDRVLQALLSRGLIRAEDDHHVLTDAGFSAIGLARPSPSTPEDEAALEQAVADAEASWMADAERSVADTPVTTPFAPAAASDAPAGMPHPPTRRRAGTKQATLIERLSRPQGASLAQLTEALGWQAHSVRGALVTVIRKFGLTLQCEKVDGIRMYHVQTEAQVSSATSSSTEENTAPLLSQGA